MLREFLVDWILPALIGAVTGAVIGIGMFEMGRMVLDLAYRASIDLDIEWSYFILVMCCTAAGAWLEWRREGSEIGQLRLEVEVIKQTMVTLEDWSGMSARQTVVEELTNKLMDEWSSGDGEDDASD